MSTIPPGVGSGLPGNLANLTNAGSASKTGGAAAVSGTQTTTPPAAAASATAPGAATARANQELQRKNELLALARQKAVLATLTKKAAAASTTRSDTPMRVGSPATAAPTAATPTAAPTAGAPSSSRMVFVPTPPARTTSSQAQATPQRMVFVPLTKPATPQQLGPTPRAMQAAKPTPAAATTKAAAALTTGPSTRMRAATSPTALATTLTSPQPQTAARPTSPATAAKNTLDFHSLAAAIQKLPTSTRKLITPHQGLIKQAISLLKNAGLLPQTQQKFALSKIKTKMQDLQTRVTDLQTQFKKDAGPVQNLIKTVNSIRSNNQKLQDSTNRQMGRLGKQHANLIGEGTRLEETMFSLTEIINAKTEENATLEKQIKSKEQRIKELKNEKGLETTGSSRKDVITAAVGILEIDIEVAQTKIKENKAEIKQAEQDKKPFAEKHGKILKLREETESLMNKIATERAQQKNTDIQIDNQANQANVESLAYQQLVVTHTFTPQRGKSINLNKERTLFKETINSINEQSTKLFKAREKAAKDLEQAEKDLLKSAREFLGTPAANPRAQQAATRAATTAALPQHI